MHAILSAGYFKGFTVCNSSSKSGFYLKVPEKIITAQDWHLKCCVGKLFIYALYPFGLVRAFYKMFLL